MSPSLKQGRISNTVMMSKLNQTLSERKRYVLFLFLFCFVFLIFNNILYLELTYLFLNYKTFTYKMYY